jgi:hypothetical protein
VTQELADLQQRRPSSQHLYCGRVPQPVRMDSPEAGPLGGLRIPVIVNTQSTRS